MESEDREIRRVFRQLRGTQEETTPSFQEVLGRVQPATSPFVPRLALIGVLAIGLILTVPMVFRREPSETDLGPLSNWQSPTEFLLDPPDRTLLTTQPALDLMRWPIPGHGSERQQHDN